MKNFNINHYADFRLILDMNVHFSTKCGNFSAKVVINSNYCKLCGRDNPVCQPRKRLGSVAIGGKISPRR